MKKVFQPSSMIVQAVIEEPSLLSLCSMSSVVFLGQPKISQIVSHLNLSLKLLLSVVDCDSNAMLRQQLCKGECLFNQLFFAGESIAPPRGDPQGCSARRP